MTFYGRKKKSCISLPWTRYKRALTSWLGSLVTESIEAHGHSGMKWCPYPGRVLISDGFIRELQAPNGLKEACRQDLSFNTGKQFVHQAKCEISLCEAGLGLRKLRITKNGSALTSICHFVAVPLSVLQIKYLRRKCE